MAKTINSKMPVSSDPLTDLKQYRPKLLSFQDVPNIAVGTTSTRVDTLKSIRELHLVARTAAGVGLTRTEIIAAISAIRVYANGVAIRDMTAQEVLDLYKYYNDSLGDLTVAGVIPIPFVRSGLDLQALSNDLAFGMLDSNGRMVNLTVEVVIASVAVLAKIEVRAWVDDRVMPVGAHVRIIPNREQVSATGKKDWSRLPVSAPGGRKLLAYHVVLDSGVISQIDVVKNNEDVLLQGASKEELELLQRSAGRTAQAGYFHVPFDLAGDPRGGEVLAGTVAAWLVQPTFTTAPTGGVAKILDEFITNGLTN